MTSRITIRTVAALIFCIATAHTATAQTRTGLKLGATLPNWTYSAVNNLSNTVSNNPNFCIVGVQEIPLYGVLSIQIEPTYSIRSFDMNFEKLAMQQLGGYQGTLPAQLPNTLTFTQRFVSLECPLLLKVSLRKEGIRPYIFAGPNISFNLSATATAKFDTTSMNITPPLDVKPKAEASYFSVDAGAGVEIPLLLSINFVADARYTAALSDLASFSAFSNSVGNARSSDIRLFAGFTFAW
ncbi:MAG: PorT family protein [Candidatus Kapabacteria bacterium]|nr:PorT family protein [Candidatus Kapabacteria bacterium]